MKIKKTVTEKALAANRTNAKRSSGPKNMDFVKQNARKHGLFSEHLHFQSEEDKTRFQELLQRLVKEESPASLLEQALLEDALTSIWKLRSTNGWDIDELINRRKAATAVVKALAENYDREQLQLFTEESKAARQGWHCDELAIRTGTTDVEDDDDALGGATNKTGHVQIEAKLTSSLETIMRYQASARRDLYRAISVLRDMRRPRENRGEHASKNA